MLIEYVTMNVLAIRKILKKYDKVSTHKVGYLKWNIRVSFLYFKLLLIFYLQVHSSANGMHFKSKLQSEHIELLQSPWLIELGAFYLNFYELDGIELGNIPSHISCDLNATLPVMTLILPDSIKVEYDLICAICLVRSSLFYLEIGKSSFLLPMRINLLFMIGQDIVFNPYALSCGHLFCKSCACSAASILIFQGPKAASPESKCPICREVCTLCLMYKIPFLHIFCSGVFISITFNFLKFFFSYHIILCCHLSIN